MKYSNCSFSIIISDLRNTIFFFLRRFKCYVWRGFSKRNGFPPLERLLLDFNPTRSHATFNLLATPSHKTIRLSLISPILLDTDPVIEDVVESVRCRLSYGGSTPSSEREDVGNLAQCSNFASKNARYYVLPASAYGHRYRHLLIIHDNTFLSD